MARTALMYMSYDLSHYLDGDISRSTSFTVSDDDAINCAHMLAAGFNTISRKMMGDFVLAVVDTKARTVEFDGKIEKLDSKTVDPWSAYSQSFTFEPCAEDADTILTLFGNGKTPTFTAAGKFSFVEESKYAHVNRDVLESAYAELQAVKEQLAEVRVETIPAGAGVSDLIDRMRDALTRADERNAQFEAQTAQRAELERRLAFEYSARTAMEQQQAEENEAARAELIKYLRGAAEKRQKLDPNGERDELQARYSGMLDVLAKFLVATGEADADEGHAAARRLVAETEE